MTDPSSQDSGAHRDLDAVKDDIAETRERLADSVDELAAKADVKARLQDGADQVKEAAAAGAQTVHDQAVTPDGRPRPAALAAVGGVLAAVVAVLTVRRRRKRGRQEL